MQPSPIPAPEERLPVPLYTEMRSWLLRNDPDASRMLTWAEKEVAPPETPERMAWEIIWIILCAGRSAQAARTIEKKVIGAIQSGRPVVEVFGYRAKAAAIERAWVERDSDFRALQSVLALDDPEALIAWCKSIPFVGTDTMYQLAKNFGVAVPKPDIWMCRLSGIPDRPRLPSKRRFDACLALCRFLSSRTGDGIAAVDSLLWLACNKGVLVTDSLASPVSLNLRPHRGMSIYGGHTEGH